MLSCQKDLFELGHEHTYLNGAYMSPQLKTVTVAGAQMLERKKQPWSITPQDFFAYTLQVRELFSRLIGCPDANRIALIPSASYGLSSAAENIPLEAGEEIIMVEEQFPSNYYIWERRAREEGASIRMIGPDSAERRAASWNQALLDAINERTKVIAMGHVHWADGTLYDLAGIREKLDGVGGYLIIDGTQSVGALPFDVSRIKPDALVVAGYKWLLGPYATGVAYYGARFDGGTPIEENWINRKGSEHFGGLVTYQEEYQPGAARYSVGEKSNFMLVPMLAAALQQILAWEPARIQEYCREIARPALQELQNLGCYLEPEAERAHHLYGIRIPESIDGERLQQELTDNKVWVSRRGTALRISPNVYNTPEDFARLLACFRRARRTTLHKIP